MTFDAIYRANSWNGIETRSGPGSHAEPTRRVATTILRLVDWLGVTSVLDVGCGEGSWMPDLPAYVGVDVSREALAEARRRHPDRLYAHVSALGELGRPDLVIVRDVVQHLPLAAGLTLLEALRGDWLLASTYVDGQNEDVPEGDAYRPNLQAPPFNYPPPLLYVPDGYVYHDGDSVRDAGKMLGLWPIAP